MKDLRELPPRNVQSRSAYFALAAFGITWVVSAWRVSPSGSWSGDYATIQGLSGSAVGAEGVVFSALAGIFRLIPIGTPAQRLGLVSAFGAAWVAWLAYQMAHQTLDRGSPGAWSGCWLALGSSLLVTLGITVQRVATAPSVATIAAASGVASVWLMVRFVESQSALRAVDVEEAGRWRAFLLGGAIAMTWLESQVVGLLAVSVGLALWALHRRALSRPHVLSLLSGLGSVFLCVGLPWYFARRSLVAACVERPLLSSLATLRPFSDFSARFGMWVSSLGPIWFAVALLGLVLSMLGVERRRAAWVVVTFGVAGALLSVDATDASGTRSTVGVIGMVALSAAAARGLCDVIRWATVRRPSAAALGTTVAVLLQAVTLLARSEEAAFVTDHYRDLGAEAWTDEALVVLPARSVIFARTQPIVERLLVAQVAEGIRPDVLIIPLDRATDPRVVAPLIATESALTTALRDLAINGRPSENAMSSLADARPLFVEFDNTWDLRLREHLLVQPFFHRVFSQTLGRSDRSAALPSGQRAVGRLIGMTAGDAVTRAIVGLRLREQLTLLLALGDRQGFEILATDYAAAFADSRWMGLLRQRLGSTNRSSIDAFDLLTERDPTAREEAGTKPR